ncbi:hypothetical protein [Pontibacter arcticus]|uniref:Tetratricopeptide repeat protein n=1 Tax=Pontibacter arcticus TaxID=2080288 RepID=A0A364RG75_9BACT|nr:hypothetical protein [Pontibacter arcticus]RAU83265.1 hypothetical protein DP923_08625 [Pontibacter arcticus]
MNKSAFLKLIQQVSNISDQQTEELEKVAAAFPYCQTAHLLLAKSAHDKGSMLSTQRLRRASSYATDRQLLKRIIYTLPDPTSEQEVNVPEPQLAVVEPVQTTEVTIESEETIIIENQDVTFYTSDLQTEVINLENTAQQENVLPEVEPQVYTLQDHLADYAFDEPEPDSELSSLLQINSLSPTFTDLLAQTPEVTEDPTAASEPEQENHTIAIPVSELPFDTRYELIEEETEDETGLALSDVLDCTFQSIDNRMAVAAGQIPTEDLAETEAPQQPEPEPIKDDAEEQAEINYSMDEIDRLYAEDVLGYWMSSSRMGEVLQLKDEYTRQKPQSFHPELILEYSKTHELEKAVQPGKHILSQQLNIIDQFLKLNPRLKTMANMKIKSEPQEDLSLKGTKIKKGIASESLAAIFLKQGKPKKAIKIYELLILKYPEKKSYFAEQIEKLQNQI